MIGLAVSNVEVLTRAHMIVNMIFSTITTELLIILPPNVDGKVGVLCEKKLIAVFKVKVTGQVQISLAVYQSFSVLCVAPISLQPD